MLQEVINLQGRFFFRCYDKHGRLKWTAVAKNIVTTVGVNTMLDSFFGDTAPPATWYLGLVDNATAPAYAVGDTMASHAGWSEFTAYSSPAARPAVAWNAAAAKSKGTSAALSFTINAAGSIAGGFLSTDSTIGGAAGTLYNESTFSGGAQAVADLDVVNVSIALSA